MIDLACRAKSKHQLIAVSAATMGTGLADGKHNYGDRIISIEDQHYLLDDGTVTLYHHQDKLNPNKKEPFSLGAFIKKRRFSLLGFKTNFYSTLNYFTMYDLTPWTNEKIILNKMIFFIRVISVQ